MRSPWMYRTGAILLVFAGGMAISIDAMFSQQWVAEVTGADQLMEGLSMKMAFIMATLASAFGAVITNQDSWLFLYAQSRSIAAIADENERLLRLIGNGVVTLIILVGFSTVYAFDLISTHATVKNWVLTFAIVFSSDLCFMMAVPLWLLSKGAKSKLDEIDAKLSGFSGHTQTVNTSGRRSRFN